MSVYLRMGLSLLCFSLLACGGNSEKRPAADVGNNEEQANSNLTTIRIDNVFLQVEVAQEEETRMQGLMYREEVPENQGMLFVFSSERILSFWMRNTFIPLDIAFISADGKIVDIQRMEPLNESKHYLSSAPALYALETNAGWFKKNGIDVGAEVLF